MPELRDMKTSLKKLFKVCCPSGPPKDHVQGESFLKALQDSEWFNQVLWACCVHICFYNML